MGKKITIEIDDNFAGVLAITAARGVSFGAVNATTYIVDLNKGTDLRIDEKGKGWQSYGLEE